MTAGRPRNKEPTKLLSVRVPASVFDPVKQFADDHAEKMSGIVVEALQAYISRVVENQCRICETRNPENAEWCMGCGAPLSDAARAKYHQQIEENRHREKLNLQWTHDLEYWVKNQVSEMKNQLQVCEKCPDRLASATSRPDDEQTLDIDPSE